MDRSIYALLPGYLIGPISYEPTPLFQVLLVVIRGFHVVGVSVLEAKADPILLVDADGPLSLPVSAEPVQPVPRRLRELLDALHPIQLCQLHLRPPPGPLRNRPRPAPLKEPPYSLSLKLLIVGNAKKLTQANNIR